MLPSEKYQNCWKNIYVDPGGNDIRDVEIEWDEITIESQLRSFL